jgi:hypothetical protein
MMLVLCVLPGNLAKLSDDFSNYSNPPTLPFFFPSSDKTPRISSAWALPPCRAYYYVCACLLRRRPSSTFHDPAMVAATGTSAHLAYGPSLFK